jgi:hypothetical protein
VQLKNRNTRIQKETGLNRSSARFFNSSAYASGCGATAPEQSEGGQFSTIG